MALDQILAALRRQAWVIAFFAAVGLALGIAYIMMAVPLYTASTDILIDKSKSNVIGSLTTPSDVFQDDADMMTQVELLKSEQLARAVSEQNGLVDNAAFLRGDPTLVGIIRNRVMSVVDDVNTLLSNAVEMQPASRDVRLAIAVSILRRGITVERLDKTYVLRLSFTSADPATAKLVANAYGAAYLDDQLEAKYDATRRASGWLQERITELKQQSFKADLAVQKYRNENGLLSTGNQLASEQQLSELNSQLIAARARTGEAKARLDQIRNILASGQTDAVVGDALASSTITSLRERYLDASRRETQIVRSLGANHPQAARLRDEMTEYERLIQEELRRIADSYDSSYNVALQSEKSLQASLDGVVGENSTANTSSVQLRELEREAETFRNLYDTFLQRYQETIQQQSFPITEARIITPAWQPGRPSFPKTPIIVALATILGVALGVGVAGLREHRDRFFRTGNQVRSELGVEFLGSIADLSAGAAAMTDGPPVRVDEGALWRQGSFNGHATTSLLSPAAETLRNIRLAADTYLATQGSKVIGVVSCLPREGKTTVSANLASLLAAQGSRVVLVDADLRNPGLTRSLRVKPEAGLVEATLGTKSLTECLVWDPVSSLVVLPVSLGRRVNHSSDVLTSPGMVAVLDQLRSAFDYVIMDLPPIGAVIDARAAAHRIDSFVMVVEWGGTSRKLVRSVMSSNAVLHDKCLGVVLNKADESRMHLYRTADSTDYYMSNYRDYYHLPSPASKLG